MKRYNSKKLSKSKSRSNNLQAKNKVMKLPPGSLQNNAPLPNLLHLKWAIFIPLQKFRELSNVIKSFIG